MAKEIKRTTRISSSEKAVVGFAVGRTAFKPGSGAFEFISLPSGKVGVIDRDVLNKALLKSDIAIRRRSSKAVA